MMKKLMLAMLFVAAMAVTRASDATYSVANGSDSATFGPAAYGGWNYQYTVVFTSRTFNYQLDLNLDSSPDASLDVFDGSTKIASLYESTANPPTYGAPHTGVTYYDAGIVLNVLAGHAVTVYVTNDDVSGMRAILDWFSIPN
jgi:hypothetical protein